MPPAEPNSSASARRTLTIAYGAEIDNLSSRMSGTVWAPDLNRMTNAALALKDDKGEVRPVLAVELPSRDQGTWVVNADGTMRTTWRIKPNATWQDGQPITSRDFAFALAVTLDSALPIANRRPEQFMERVEPVDDKTFLIHWKEPYPWADELIAQRLEPLPDHLMGKAYAELPAEAFVAHPFWSSEEYVSAGPYRLTQWDRGVQLRFQAFGDYVLGKPKIDEVIFRIIPDPNTVLANLLAGEVGAAVNIALGQRAGAELKQQWDQTKAGTALPVPTRFRFVAIQFRPDSLTQPAMLDVRVRRAIVHGLDRATLATVATKGLVSMTEIFLAPNDPLYQRADQVVAKYPFDPNRALALLQEAGWTRRGDALIDAGGQRFTLHILSSEGADNEFEQNVIAADLRNLGIDVQQEIYPRSRAGDREMRATFSGLNPTALVIQNPETLRTALSDQCPSPATRWAGNNRGCWSNAEFDRLYQIAASSLDRAERDNAVVQALKIVTEDVGFIPLSYRADVIAFTKGLVGPVARHPDSGGDTWNVHEWRWERSQT